MDRKEKAMGRAAKSPAVFFGVFAVLIFVLVNSALAGTSGIFITKPNPWSSTTEVDETKSFSDIEDHSGYLTVTLQGGGSEQVSRALLTALIYKPTIPTVIPNNASLTYLTKYKAYLQQQSLAHPTAASIINQWVLSISKALASYKAPVTATDATSSPTDGIRPGSTNTQLNTSTARDLITTSGERYHNYTISRVEPDGLILVTDSGVEKVYFTNLSQAIQTRYGYDPAKAAEFHAAEQASAAQQASAQDQQAVIADQQATVANVSQTLDKTAVLVSGNVLSVTDDGVLLTDALIRIPAMHNVVTYQNPLDGTVSTKPVAGYDTVSSDEPIFIYGIKDLVDSDPVPATTVYLAPHYSYDSAGGAAKTVRAFATSKELAIKLFQKASK